MHDPMTVAWDIKRPWPRLTREGFERKTWGRFYWPTWITIWHVDPERDGSDDSCGWFPRARHGDQVILKQIQRAFTSEWGGEGHHGWFDSHDRPNMDTSSIVLDMFLRAAQQVYMGRLFDRHGWRGARRFCRRHLLEILRFAGNGTDSWHTFIRSSYGIDRRRPQWREERIEEAAAIVYGFILRQSRPWYRHPRWHVWHWSIQVHPIQAFKRWAFSRCAGCGHRFRYGYAPTSGGWSSDGPRWFRSECGVYHSECFPRPSSAK